MESRVRVPLHKQDMVQVSSLPLPAVLKPETENARVDGTNRPGLELVVGVPVTVWRHLPSVPIQRANAKVVYAIS